MAAHWPAIIIFFIGAYLVGSISSAVVVCKLLGYPDPRDVGSGNPGATNVLRVAGKPAAALTFAGDLLKGVVPVLLARLVGFDPMITAITGILAVTGHLFPIFFQFRGGKGIATAFGLVFVLSWLSGIITGLVWLAVFLIARISSLASILAFIAMPFAIYWLAPAIVWPMAGLTLILLARHHANIRRLLTGQEASFKKNNAG